MRKRDMESRERMLIKEVKKAASMIEEIASAFRDVQESVGKLQEEACICGDCTDMFCKDGCPICDSWLKSVEPCLGERLADMDNEVGQLAEIFEGSLEDDVWEQVQNLDSFQWVNGVII